MMPYTLHVATLITVCLIFYKLFLQKETFYRLNRIVLTGSLAVAFLLPLLTVPAGWSIRSLNNDAEKTIQTMAVQQNLSPSTVLPESKTGTYEKVSVQPGAAHENAQNIQRATINWPMVWTWLVRIYWIGVIIFSLNLLLQLVLLGIRIWRLPKIKDGRFCIVELSGNSSPCSFGNYIFINPAAYDWETYNQVLIHEKIHIEQGHSFDLFLGELVLVFQWFNPFAWIYRKNIEKNLEFLADSSVLNQDGIKKEAYQMNLLKVSVPQYSLGVTTNYNQSLLKTRIAMMNAKRSNYHTMWKYFFLLPLFAGLVCILNNTSVTAQSSGSKNAAHHHTNSDRFHGDHTKGSWFATIKGDSVRMEFRSDDDSYSGSNSEFKVSEFSNLPRDKEGEFTLTREEGTMHFKGKFDGNKGYGDYRFESNKDYLSKLEKQGIKDMDENDAYVFFILDIKISYVTMIKENGYPDITKGDLIPLSALKVDESYIKMMKENGFKDLAPNDLVSSKAMGIDKNYITEIHEAGYKDISMSQLISFKAQKISGEYIKGLKKTKLKLKENDKDDGGVPDANEVTAFKAMNIDENYIKSFEDIGYKDISYNELTAMKSMHVTPEYIKSFENIGYHNIPVSTFISMKSMKVTPEYVKGFRDAGFTDLSLNELVSTKALGITVDYIKSFRDMGFTSNNLNSYIPLKSLGITPEYINGFKKLGFKDISLNELPALKATGVTPEFISSMQEKGIKLSSLEKYIQLKTAMN